MAGKTYSVKTEIRGKDHASSVFARVGRSARASLGGITGAVGKVGGALTSLPVIGSVLGGGLGVGALVEWVGEWAKAGDEIAKTSRRIGVSSATLQELQYAAGLAGVETQVFAVAMKTAARNIGQLKTGSGPLKELLRSMPALGKAIKGSDTEGALAGLFEAMARIQDPAKRAAFASAAFGEEGAKLALIAEKGTEALAATRREFRELGGVIGDEALTATEDYNDALSRLGVAWGGLKNVFGAAFVKTALPYLGQLTTWFKDNQGRLGALAEGFATDLVGGIKSVVSAIPDLVAGLQAVVGVVKDIASWVSKAFSPVMDVVSEAQKIQHMRLVQAGIADASGRVLDPTLAGVLGFERTPYATGRGAIENVASGVRAGGAAVARAARDAAFARLLGAGVSGGDSKVTVRIESAVPVRTEVSGTNPPKVETGRRLQGATR